MFAIKILPVLFICLLLSGCNKENGKHDYEMRLMFDNGDIYTDSGKMYEKPMHGKKYREKIHDAFNLNESQGKAVYIEVFNGYILLKVDNHKFVCSDQLFWHGLVGDIYLEGNYTQKGRAYTVNDGYFEVIWRDNLGNPVSNSVLTGKWTLKRS
ncbi:hypothetical protein [Fluviicola sp.]|jgi:hypothetical protein|uniref:hypothetical protein n=1 Tax=Fluviicola sp. TaxID=1917219 RepID=UPI0028330967|nr:hypothetical protein [Fluviicola sp.]MDR0801130.1 hypothetical protein [Fluviicola sp.]